MYIASCPLRVSLFGGSTDNPYFVEKYGRGSVISFTSNLKTYVAISQDTIGYNNQGKYIINYSRREEVSSINEIENIGVLTLGDPEGAFNASRIIINNPNAVVSIKNADFHKITHKDAIFFEIL